MKTLVIVIHSQLEHSRVNKSWTQELQKHPDKYTIHNLHLVYPDEKIAIQREQQLLEQYDKIVFQFPFYWFNCPPLFKKWLDEVLTEGWAYGSGSRYALRGKKIALAITAGIHEQGYSPSGRYKYTLKQLTAPFELTFQYIKADYKALFAFYGAEHEATPARIITSTRNYLSFLESF